MNEFFKRLFVDPEPDDPAKFTKEIATSAKRYLAFMIDYTWITLVLAGAYPFFMPEQWDQKPTGELVVALVPVYGLGIFLFLFRDAFGGSSIGKSFLNLYVANLDKEMTLASQAQRIKRNLTLVILPVEIAAILLDKYARRYGDKWAGTLVVERIKPPKVRRITHKALGAMTLVCALWSLYVFAQPVSIKKASGFRQAQESLVGYSPLAEVVGESWEYGYWPEVEYAFDHTTYGFEVKGSLGRTKVEVVLDTTEAQPKVADIRLIRDEKSR